MFILKVVGIIKEASVNRQNGAVSRGRKLEHKNIPTVPKYSEITTEKHLKDK